MNSLDDKNFELVQILVQEQPSQIPEGEQRGGYEEHAGLSLWQGWAPRTTVDIISLEKFQESYERVQYQVNSLLAAERPTDNGWGVQEITVKLGISAKGGLAFIAEAGAEASVEMKFSRPSQ